MRRTLAALLRNARHASLGKRERALVLVPQGAEVDAHLLARDADGHGVSVVESREGVAWEEVAHAHPLAARYLPPVVVATPALDAATLTVPVAIARANPAARVHPSEFQDALRRLHVSLWAEHRPRVAEGLGVEPIDAVLTSFRVDSVRIGGSEVLDPRELAGGEVELDVAVRFVRRDTFERAREATGAPFFADPAWALVAGHGAAAPAALLARTSPAVLVTGAREVGGMREIGRHALSWSPDDVTREIELRFALSRAAARRVLAQHVAGETSGPLAAAIAEIVAAPRAALDRELRAAGVAGPLATLSDVAIPASEAKGAVALVPLEAREAIAPTGLALESEADPLVLAAFGEFYYNERYSELNAWLRQRITWLGTGGTA